jgi:hypothetical protein
MMYQIDMEDKLPAYITVRSLPQPCHPSDNGLTDGVDLGVQ